MKTVMCMVIVMVAALIAAFAPPGEAAITCGSVFNYVRPCIGYVTNTSPLGSCCGGVKALSSAAKTTPERQTACGCLKSLTGSIPGVDQNKVAGLPRQCGVSLPYKISPSTDCSRVQ